MMTKIQLPRLFTGGSIADSGSLPKPSFPPHAQYTWAASNTTTHTNATMPALRRDSDGGGAVRSGLLFALRGKLMDRILLVDGTSSDYGWRGSTRSTWIANSAI